MLLLACDARWSGWQTVSAFVFVPLAFVVLVLLHFAWCASCVISECVSGCAASMVLCVSEMFTMRLLTCDARWSGRQGVRALFFVPLAFICLCCCICVVFGRGLLLE